MQNLLLLFIASISLSGCLSTGNKIIQSPNIIDEKHSYLIRKYDLHSNQCIFSPQYNKKNISNSSKQLLTPEEAKILNHKIETKMVSLYHRVKLISSRYKNIDYGKVMHLKKLSKEFSHKHNSPFHHIDQKINISDSMNYFKEVDRMVKNIPLFMPIKKAQISSKFGRRKLKGRKRCMHKGLDLVGVKNGRIYASANGKVLESSYSRSYGNYILIQHQNNLKTRYAHLKRSMVSPGKIVKQGEPIGIQGSTGRSTRDHLHFEVILGKKHLNPINFIGKEVGCHKI